MAAFMSSVMRSLSVVIDARARPATGSECAGARCSREIPRCSFLVALDGGCLLALTFLGRLLVEFATAKFGQYAGLFASSLEAAQGGIEIFVLTDANARHRNLVINSTDWLQRSWLAMAPPRLTKLLRAAEEF